jgi:hypothetical protein
VDLQTILNVIRAGVAIESSAGHRGWSATGTFFISNELVDALADGLHCLAGAGNPEALLGPGNQQVLLAET